MVHLVKIALSFLILRWLPLGWLFGGLARLAVWAGVIFFGVKLVKKLFGKEAEPTYTSPWTEPATSFDASAFARSGPADDEVAAKTVSDVEIAIAEALAAAEQPAVASSTVAASSATDEGAKAAAAVEEAIREALESAEQVFPDWEKPGRDNSCPDDHPVKAKTSSNIYHVPGHGNYDRTIPDVCFASAKDAELAGYRPSRR